MVKRERERKDKRVESRAKGSAARGRNRAGKGSRRSRRRVGGSSGTRLRAVRLVLTALGGALSRSVLEDEGFEVLLWIDLEEGDVHSVA